MKIDIIIPNYNGFSLLDKNLPKVIESVSYLENVSFIIVDDNSREDEFISSKNFVYEAEKKNDIKIKLLRNNQNLGFSSTVNRGVFESKADLVVLLNTDIVPKGKFLDPIIKDFSKDPNLFGVGCMDESLEGSKVVFRGRGLGRWKRGFVVHSRGEIDRNDTFWVSGGSSVIRRDLFLKLGGFDTLYNPFYWEDIDLSYRAQKQGFNILFERESVVVHEHLQGAIKSHNNNLKVKTVAYRNQFIFIWKNITDLNLILSHIIWFPYHFLKALLRFDIAFFYAFILALYKFPVIIFKRTICQKYFVKKDKEILNS